MTVSPCLSFPILYSSLPHSRQWEDRPLWPQCPLITDGAMCKDRLDLLRPNCKRQISVWPSLGQAFSLSDSVISVQCMGLRGGEGVAQEGTASGKEDPGGFLGGQTWQLTP